MSGGRHGARGSLSREHEGAPASGVEHALVGHHPLPYGHEHAHACDCAPHRTLARAGGTGRLGAVLLPVVACAVCPACLATYAKVFSVLGVGVTLSEAQHLALLGAAVGLSVVVSAWRSWRSRRIWPAAVALGGTGLIVLGHLVSALHHLEWMGVLVLLAGGLTEHFRLARLRPPVTLASAEEPGAL